MQALKPTDQLSVTYACLNQKNLVLNYVNLGINTLAVGRQGSYQKLNQVQRTLSRDSGIAWIEQQEQIMMPGDRLLFLSGGFEFSQNLAQFLDQEPKDTLNELAFSVKKGLSSDDLPASDATALVVDLDSRSLRMAQ